MRSPPAEIAPSPWPTVVTIPLPSLEHNAPTEPEGNWRNFVHIETGSSWGTKQCNGCDVIVTTPAPIALPGK